MKPSRLSSSLTVAISTFIAAIWVVPYMWMLSTSFKTLPEILQHPKDFFPQHVDFGAYREVFRRLHIVHSFSVTLFVAFVIGALQILFVLPAGYAFAKLDFKGRKSAFGLVIAGLLVPAQVTFLPSFLIFANVGLINTVWSLILPFSVSAVGTFLVRQALFHVPNEIIEAARLDGASEFTIIYRILGPMVRPTLASLFLISFVFHYNDYFWPLVMTTDDSVRTLPLEVALFREQGTGVRWHAVMASNVILSLPILVLFAFYQRYLTTSITGKKL